MLANTKFLKNNAKATLSHSLIPPVSFSIEGFGDIEIISDQVVRFIAPNNGESGSSVITVSDADGNTDSITISYGTYLHTLANFFQVFLGLTPDQIILGWDTFKIPSDSKPRIVIDSNVNPIGNNSKGGDDPYTYTNFNDTVTIQVYGIGNNVMHFAKRVLRSLTHPDCELVQEINGMKINKISQLLNTTAAEGSRGLKRFTLALNVFYNEVEYKEFKSYDEYDLSFIQEQ